MRSAAFRQRLLDRARAAKVTLASASVDQIEAFYVLLNHWNKRINLTALPLEAMSDRALDRVLVEPLVAAAQVDTSPLSWCDLGSGGGSPAIPMRIVRPGDRLTLVESRSRKAAFLREVVRELSLSDVTVINDRFENLAGRVDLGGTSDLVTVRAVRTDAALFDASHRLLRRGAEFFVFAKIDAGIQPASGFEFSRSVALIPGSGSELVVFKVR